IEAVARAKSEIVSGLAEGGVAVLNADDDRVAAMSALAERVVTFGEARSATVRAADLRLEQGRARFTLTTPEGEAPVHLTLVGAHHVTNPLAAAAVAPELRVRPQPVPPRVLPA